MWAGSDNLGAKVRNLAALFALAVLAAFALALLSDGRSPAPAEAAKPKIKKGSLKQVNSTTEEVLFVGNNWEGTADVLRFRPAVNAKQAKKCKKAKTKAKRKKCRKAQKKKSQKPRPVEVSRLARLNIIPDYQERMQEILTDPIDLVYFLAIRLLIGEGNDQFVDDMYSSPDGKLLVVSRPSFADVVGINIATGKVAWRFRVGGQRSDHMALSPDGRHVAVSASTANVVHILETQTGKEVGFFPSGDSPHENTYSKDGSKIYHASIGLVYTPADHPIVDTTKGDRWFQVVDAKTNQLISRVDMGQKLEEAGYPDMSSAVRPMAISADERTAYLQVSFFHGFIEYDLVNERVVRVVDLPIAPNMPPRELYLLDSAHHGIALNGKDDTLCVAGTMSDYAALVDVSNPADRVIFDKSGTKPYWSTTSNDGNYCFVSWSGTDSISVFDYAKRKEVVNFPVGDHPQRIRTGNVSKSWIASLKTGG